MPRGDGIRHSLIERPRSVRDTRFLSQHRYRRPRRAHRIEEPSKAPGQGRLGTATSNRDSGRRGQTWERRAGLEAWQTVAYQQRYAAKNQPKAEFSPPIKRVGDFLLPTFFVSELTISAKNITEVDVFSNFSLTSAQMRSAGFRVCNGLRLSR